MARDITGRKTVEAALPNFTTRTSTILDSISDGFATLNRDWKFTYLNDRAVEILAPLKKSRENLLGSSHWEQFPDLVGTPLEQKYRRAMTEKVTLEHEFFYPPLDAWIEVRVYSAEDGIVVYFQDVSVRHLAFETVKASERLYRAIGDSIDYGIWICAPDGRTTFASESFLKLVGLTQEQCPEYDWAVLLHPDDEERTVAAWKECVRTRGKLDIEHRFRGVDGHWHPILARGVPVWNERGEFTGWTGINLDISGLKKVEGALRESEERFRVAVLAVSNILWTNNSEGMMEGEQPGWASFTGQSLEEYQGYGWSRAIHPDDAQPTVEAWNQAVAGKHLFHFEHRVRRHDGAWRTCLVRALPIRGPKGEIREWVGVHTDITEDKVTEEKLREANTRLEFALESAGVGDWDLDLTTDKARRSLRHDQAFGYTEPVKEWGYETFLAHVHPDDRSEVDRRFGAAISQNREWHFECRVVWPDGTLHWVEAHGDVYRTEDGQARNMLGIVKNVTERKTAEEAIRIALEELARVSRAKDDFLAALSHELRTPLTPVLMAAGELRDDGSLPAEARAQLAMMERNIALEARLIDDLLDLTTIARGKLQLRTELCDTHALINLAVEIVQAEAEAKNITIERVLTAPHSGLIPDPARFQQVIWNLLRNAVKFTPAGGRISIGTTEEKKPAGGRWLRITVVDTGIGIPPTAFDKIFLPFEQAGVNADHRYGGLGLGLAIAKAVVELHGGRIQAFSEGANLGATFVVELPGAVYPQSHAAGDATPGSESTAPFLVKPTLPAAIVPLRLLLVEDHESTLQTLARLLRRDGHTVTTASTIAAALATAAAGTFDVVVSDLGLPDGTGNELMEELRRTYGLRGIALSGYGMEEDLIRSRAAGFATHLVKPVRVADLRAALLNLTKTGEP